MDVSSPRYETIIGATSLIVGPALMSVGDLFHPAESWDPAAQVGIVTEAPSRWYTAHLLLFLGMLLLVPGILTLTRVARDRRPAAGYAARLLLLVSVGAFSAVIVCEMLLASYVAKAADQAAAVLLLETCRSAEVFGALAPGLLAFFVGIGLAVMSLAYPGGPFRWPALGLALGAGLILGEIFLAKVLLSQIGNIVIFVAGVSFARLLLRRRERAWVKS